MKTFLYIDGFNLYYSAVKGTPLRWLNPIELAARAFSRNTIFQTKFFTAKVAELPGDPISPRGNFSIGAPSTRFQTSKSSLANSANASFEWPW